MPILSLFGRLLFRAPVHDFQYRARGLRQRACAPWRLQSRWNATSEMIVKAVVKELRIIPKRRCGSAAPSGTRTVHPTCGRGADGWSHLRLLLMLSPRWVFLSASCWRRVPSSWPRRSSISTAGSALTRCCCGAAGLVCGIAVGGPSPSRRASLPAASDLADGRWGTWMSSRGILEKLLVAGSLSAPRGSSDRLLAVCLSAAQVEAVEGGPWPTSKRASGSGSPASPW